MVVGLHDRLRRPAGVGPLSRDRPPIMPNSPQKVVPNNSQSDTCVCVTLRIICVVAPTRTSAVSAFAHGQIRTVECGACVLRPSLNG
jgi:hypothetical protein